MMTSVRGHFNGTNIVPDEEFYFENGEEVMIIVSDKNTKQRKPSQELLEAMQEAEDILSGKIEAKSYQTAEEMISDILSEDDNDEI